MRTFNLHARVVHWVASRRGGVVARALARASRSYLDLHENLSYDAARNGEARVLDVLSQFGMERIFDVGANVGDWSAAAAQRAPEAEVHAFEVVPAVAAEARRRTASLRVTVNAFGLSDQAGTVPVHYRPDESTLSTATGHVEIEDGRWEIVDCEVRRGDDYCIEREIDSITLLKIDTEGLEAQVLDGFARTLREGKVDVVQFEYGRINAATRVLLADLYERFEVAGYAVGKVFPRSVEFRTYDVSMETFRGSNHLAVRRDREDLLRALA